MKSKKPAAAEVDPPVSDCADHAAPEDEGFNLTAEVPSWLTSLVCHLTLLVLMALLSTAGHGLGNGIGMSVEMAPGGSQGSSVDDDLGPGSLSKPTELASNVALQDATDKADLTAAIAAPIDPMPSVELQPLASTKKHAAPASGAGDVDGTWPATARGAVMDAVTARGTAKGWGTARALASARSEPRSSAWPTRGRGSCTSLIVRRA